MKILIDSNVIISAALSRNSAPYKAFVKAVSPPNRGCICTQNEEECRRIFADKFPNRVDDLNRFLEKILGSWQILGFKRRQGPERHCIENHIMPSVFWRHP